MPLLLEWLITTFFWQFEGWESFDQRRRLKHQKQLDFRVVGSAEFDEGADKNWWFIFKIK